MTTHDIRAAYLRFFEKQGHVVIPSSSLLPENDPTTLFTGSGMQPMVPYLLGETHPLGTRIADSQKCFRSQDIEDIGDNRHTTFFEMLGNWSLGDYFKEQQIPWMFQFLIEEIGLDPKRLYVTCYSGNEKLNIPKDQEAAMLWQKLFKEHGIEAETADIGSEAHGYERGIKDGERIFFYNGSKNWWSRGGNEEKTPVGDPCGPDSEMFYDFGTPHDPSFGEHCHPNCDCGRFMEIGNNVFMAYRKVDQETFVPLDKPNIDHGSGLERIAAAKNDTPDVLLIDAFDGMRAVVERVSGKKYGAHSEETKAFRVILDHLRAAVFLISDNAVPSNKDQGYFTRRLIRRAVRYAHVLGIKDVFTKEVAQAVIDSYSAAYPSLLDRKDVILAEIDKEEKKFKNTLEKGLKEVLEIIRVRQITGSGTVESKEGVGVLRGDQFKNLVITGEEAFNLLQSYGIPVELTQEIAQEHGLTVDMEGFEMEKTKHQQLSRLASEKKFKGGLADHSEMSVKYHTATHLLHAAVQKVLGSHAVQKGSNITPERLRFDFAHPEKLTDEQKQQIEDLVNAAIARNYPVTFAMMSMEDARAKGAIGLFEDNYGDQVKVYTVGNPELPATGDATTETFSREFCGGPHVEQTGTMGHFKITKEEACSAGVRRIKAILE